MILLDTHVLVWMNQDDPALGKTARRRIQAAWDEGQVAVSAISFWECEMLNAAGRLQLLQPAATWRAELLAASLIEIPVGGDVAIASVQLAGLHKDPADRMIVATAIARNAALITADRKLLDWKNPLLRYDAQK